MKTNELHINLSKYYGYDVDSRLVSDISSGTFIDINLNPISIANEYSVSYSPSGKITNKKLQGQNLENYGVSPRSENYDYYYQGTKAQQMSSAKESVSGRNEIFGWDNKGNMNYASHGERRLCWTEDNRLQGFSDRDNGAYYGYDASGERAYKLTGPTVGINQNGLNFYSPIFQNITIYASPLITLRDGEYTKHYFEESKRICSAIGNGGLKDIDGSVEDMGKKHEDLRTIHEQGVEETFHQCLGIGIYNDIKDLYGFLDKFRDSQVNPNEPNYYFTSDHLGSSSYITNDQGQVTQTMAYMPYGEDWVNLNYSQNFQSQYKYNGKEKDEESGYYNYGARYYSSDLPIWISVDPLSDKYPHLTGYVYCANNPIMLIDPDGRELDVATNEQSKNDLKSIVSDGNKDRIIINENGNVSVNTDGLSNEQLSKDKGLSLINDMVRSDKKFLYEASDGGILNYKGEETGMSIVRGLVTSGVMNASNNGRDSDDKHTFLPKKGYDGQVIISPSSIFKMTNNRTSDRYDNVRPSLIFHELMENYIRTESGYDYQGNQGNDNVGAHDRAAKMESNHYLNSQPGQLTRVKK